MPESPQTDGALLSAVIDRLDADAKAKPFEAYVLAAFDGADALAKLLESDTPPTRPKTATGTAREPRGA